MNNYLLIFFLSPFVYFVVAICSLGYFSAKYDNTEGEIRAFLSSLKFPLTLFFREKPNYFFLSLSNREDPTIVKYLLNITYYEATIIRYIFALVSAPFLILSIVYVFMPQKQPFIKLIDILMMVSSWTLFYYSWRFGHSLKPKAQPPTD